jgi:hypothetical protein
MPAKKVKIETPEEEVAEAVPEEVVLPEEVETPEVETLDSDAAPVAEPKLYTRRQLEIASLTGAQRAYSAAIYALKDRSQPQQIERILGLLYPVLYAMETLGCQVQPTSSYVQWKNVNAPRKKARG